jgi:hypothetical protein
LIVFHSGGGSVRLDLGYGTLSIKGNVYLEDNDVGVWVLNRRDSAVGVETQVRLLLHLGRLEKDLLKRECKLFQDDGDFPGVRA